MSCTSSSSITLVITIAVIALVVYYAHNAFKLPELPTLEPIWWGPKLVPNSQLQGNISRSFTVNISCEILDDLKHRLQITQEFVPPLEDTQHYGLNTNLLRQLIDFWQTKYNWREREVFLNRFPQFIVNVQGLDIHYIRVRPNETKKDLAQNNRNHVKILPLLLLHGWPGSHREFYELIPMLTTTTLNASSRDFVFDVVVPSLPGYGFSSGAQRPGLGAAQMAVVFKSFMQVLGFERFYAQGGDLGAVILHHLAVLYPEAVLGLHSNMCVAYNPWSVAKVLVGGVLWPTLAVRQEHLDRIYPLSKLFRFYAGESGYFHIQVTKPDTVSVGLADSPAALAAYILEKFVTGRNFEYQQRADGGFGPNPDFTSVLDNIMIYWVTRSMPTAVRLYAETFNTQHSSMRFFQRQVLVPMACSRFKHDFYFPDVMLYDNFPYLVHLSDYDGSHFAAFYSPEILAKDIFLAVEKFLNLNAFT